MHHPVATLTSEEPLLTPEQRLRLAVAAVLHLLLAAPLCSAMQHTPNGLAAGPAAAVAAAAGLLQQLRLLSPCGTTDSSCQSHTTPNQSACALLGLLVNMPVHLKQTHLTPLQEHPRTRKQQQAAHQQVRSKLWWQGLRAGAFSIDIGSGKHAVVSCSSVPEKGTEKGTGMQRLRSKPGSSTR